MYEFHGSRRSRRSYVSCLICAPKNSSHHAITKDELRNILEALHELFDLGGRSALNKSLELNQAVIDSIFDRLDINHGRTSSSGKSFKPL